ncbi:phosphate ABC transporter permease subunit PstC [Roseisolibacter agri]|uniref:Phosphate transport system permease protein n=1 Tax=Roseisolibacter agri TaxID=2014610 RepID=A0AA37QFQ2_9BACT|nr:phosphate ABC transporter permease subunit PstC [Roseisolibacter agri]GLC28041.1 phosphate transport system permease protein [Roseisolibacter agri]
MSDAVARSALAGGLDPSARARATPPAAASVRIEGSAAGDRIYRGVTTALALCVPLLLLAIAIALGVAAWPALRTAGLSFLTSSEWDATRGTFGAAPALYGTLVSSALAIALATPLALGSAIFLSEFAPRWLRTPAAFLIDLLAAVPSVVYGLWAVFVLLPLLREHVMPFLQNTLHLGSTPLFSGPAYGPSMLAAGLILAVMVLPYVAAVAREVLLAVPRSQREAALALGATRWEMIRDAVLPYARSGIIGGVVLGLGRALGETMAVTMVIGNRHEISSSLFSPGYTMASLVANEFSEATGDLHLSSLMAVGAVLFAVTLVVNAIARYLVWRVSRRGRA